MAIPKVYESRTHNSDLPSTLDIKFDPNKILRDEFAMAALPAMINQFPHITKTMVADDCYSYADAMLRARQGTKHD